MGGVARGLLGGAGVPDRLRKARGSAARRASICRYGQVSSAVAVWSSREGWIAGLRAWAESPAFRAVCASVRVSMTAATLMAIAVVMAEFADHSSGRNAAVTKEVIAARVGCHVETVKRAWRLLAAARWALKVREGHGSRSTPSVGNRAAIWHLISRPQSVDVSAGSVDNVPLPPLGGSSLSCPVGTYSPRARLGAPEQDSADKKRPPVRRYRTAPRPLPIQRLAAQLVVRCHGLDRGHIGAVCDAITGAGIDPGTWSAQSVTDALNGDMRATGWSWPDRIERPGAFLANRLRRLMRPGGPLNGGGKAAAGPDGNRAGPRHVALPPVVLTAAQRGRIAAVQDQFKRHLERQRRERQLRCEPASTTVLRKPVHPGAAGVCQCGAPDAPRRRYLPARRAHLCDACWTQ